MMNVIYVDTNTSDVNFVKKLLNVLPEEIKHNTMILPKECDFKENLSFQDICDLKKSIDDLYYLGISKEGK